MAQLLELVFESATKARAAELMQDLATVSGSEYAVICDGKTILPETSLNKLLSDTHSCAAMRFLDFAMPGIGVVPGVVVRVLKTAEDLFDIEVSLDLDDVEHLENFAPALCRFASGLAQRHRIRNFFAGLEPACDHDTRIFTQESLGPLELQGPKGPKARPKEGPKGPKGQA